MGPAASGPVRLDGARVRDVPALHTELARALDLPDHYGRNLDALADVLRDVDPGTVVVWEGWAAFADAEPDAFATVTGLLGTALVLELGEPG